MPITDDRYDGIKRYADNLTTIASNIETINYQDSLLAIAALDPVAKKEASFLYSERKKTSRDIGQSR